VPDNREQDLLLDVARSHAIIENAQDAIIAMSLDGKVTTWNAGAARLFGYSAAEMIGGPMIRLFPPGRLDEEGELIARVIRGTTISNFVTRRVRKDGAYIEVSVTLSPVRDSGGAMVGVSNIARDITERKQQEEESRALEARFRVLTDAMPQCVWTCKPDGWMEYFNQRWIDYTGLTLEQSQGWGWGSVVHPDDVQHCVRTWNDALESGQAYEFEFRLLRASDGTYRWHLGRGVPFRDVRGAIVKWLGTATNIDDYKAAEAKNLALQSELEDRVQQRTAQLARVGKIAGVGGWSITVASGTPSWSDETCRILDAQPGHQPTLDEVFGLYAQGSREIIEAACRNCMANAVPFDVELELTTTQGRSIWARTVGEAQMEQGNVVRIFGAFQDNTARKLAELALFDQHELLRVTLESIGDAVITTDAQGRVQSLNPVAARLTGWGMPESRALPVEQVFDIRDTLTHQGTLELLNKALSYDGSAGTGRHTVLTARDGREFGIEDSVAPIRDQSGQRVGTVLVFRDISARNHAVHALRIANERFALAADAAGIGVWEWDLSTHTLLWDDQMYRLFGRSPATGVELYALWVTSLHAEDRVRIEREVNEALRGVANFDTEFRIVLPNREVRHLKLAAQVQRDGAGVAIRMIGVNFDITARKRAEIDLKETSSLLRRVLDSANDLAIVATTPDHTIRVFNKGAEHMLGYAGAELIDSATAVAFHDASEVAARGRELSTLLGRPVQGAAVFIDPTTLDIPREWTFIRKDQRRVPVLLNVTAMFDDSGTLSGYLGVARDITRDQEHHRSLQQAKSQAERANAAKSEFLANMSHEIRTPLNSVIGLGYLLEQTSMTVEQRSYLRKINFAGRSLLSVINNVLDLSKIEAGEMLLEDGTLDLKHLVQGIGQMLTPSAHAKGIALVVNCAANLPSRLRGDATRLGQIVTNLMNNAIKFTAMGKVELTLSCSKPTDAGVLVRLSVRDSGIGITPDALPRLFKAFSQADTSTTRRFGGTGLGLSITHRLVDLMGGKIGVTSTVGVGSEFCVLVPLRRAVAPDTLIERAPSASLENSQGTRSLAGVKILVVDDSEINCEVAQLILRRHGAIVATSGTGAEALARLRQDPNAFEIVLMDVQMPDMDGNEATRRIRTELHLELPIIALTAGALVSERERSLQAGMNDFLTKPFEPTAFVAIIRRYIEEKPIVLV